jgi:WD40 repeat protein
VEKVIELHLLFSFICPRSCLRELSLSPQGDRVVGLSNDGSVTLWDFPSLRFTGSWSPQRVSGAFRAHSHNENHSSSSSYSSNSSSNSLLANAFDPTLNLTQVQWWSNTELVLLRPSGELAIVSVPDFTNKLAEGTTNFGAKTKISTVG